MTFFIETYCGQKRGGWRRGTTPYPDAQKARDAIFLHLAQERAAKGTPMKRRFVEVTE